MTSRSSAKTQRQLHSAEWFRHVRRCLRAWFRSNARDLPWRRTRDPYAIWISEIMLQQTQVATVERYFPRFLAEFPDVVALAAASESDVLRQWEGLGYYRRARQMHAAARQIVSDHRGQFPCEFDAVRQLPGIGRYTAGAILSIAFDAAHPILEANTIRLLSRLWAYRGNTHDRTGQMLLWNAATSLLSTRGNGELNQALHGTWQLDLHAAKSQMRGVPVGIALPDAEAGVAGPDPGSTTKDSGRRFVRSRRRRATKRPRSPAAVRRRRALGGSVGFSAFSIAVENETRRRHRRERTSNYRRCANAGWRFDRPATPFHHAAPHGHAVPNHAAWLRGTGQKRPAQRQHGSISLGETGPTHRISAERDRSKARPAMARAVQ